MPDGAGYGCNKFTREPNGFKPLRSRATLSPFHGLYASL